MKLLKWQKGLVVAAVVVVVYAALGALLVPWILRGRILGATNAYLHRPATLNRVRFNPFTLKATLSGFDLRDHDGSRLLAFDTMVVNLSLASIPLRARVLDEFRLVRPLIVVRVESNGRLAIADILAERDTTTPPPEAGPSSPPRVQIARLSLEAGEVVYIDNSRSPRYEEDFTDLGVTVDGLSTLPNHTGDHVLTANFASGAQLRWSGQNTVRPLRLNGELNVTGVPLPKIAEVLGGGSELHLVRGVAEANFHYEVRQDSGQALQATVPSASLSATDLAVRPKDAAEDWAKLSRFSVEGITAEWPQRSVRIAAVRLNEPWIRAARLADSTVDWTHYMPRASARTPDSTTVPSKPSAPWQVRLDSLALTGGSVHLTDHLVQPAAKVDVRDIRVALSPVTNDSTTPVGIDASAAMGKRSSLSVTGQATQFPFATDLDVSLRDLDLKLGQPYVRAKVPAQLTSGSLSVRGKAKLRKTRPNMVFDGGATVARFELQDSVGDSLLAFRGLKVTGIHLTSAPDLLRIKQIAIDSPFARIAVSRERTLNLTTLVPQTTDTSTHPYEIQEVAFTGGTIDFSDESLILPFRARIDSTWGFIRDVASFGGTAGTLELEGKVEPYGLSRANGTIRLTDPFAATDIRADFRNVDMTTLTPYSAQFAGYSIKDGKLDLDLEYHIKDRQLQASHKIVATNLTLGPAVEGGESPGFLIKLAISLLKDKEGRIKLDVPVEGTVDSPEFSYRGIVWHAIKSVLGKIATAPFRFLGKLLGIGGDDVELVDFDPGRVDVIAPEKEKLDSLSAELGRKPELTLSVEGRYDSISDVAALREASLQRQIAGRRDSLSGKAQSDTSTTMLAQIMESLYEGKFGRPARDSLEAGFKAAWAADTAHASKKFDPSGYQAELRARLLAAQPVGAGDLEQLGRDRASAIVAALLSGGLVDSTRVKATDPAPVKKKKAGSSRVPSEMTMDAK